VRPAGLAIAVALAGGTAAAAQHGSPIAVGQVERNDVWSVLFLTAVVLAFVVYVVAVLVLRRGGGSVPVILAFAVVIQLIPLAGPLLGSRDVYSYWAYARIAAVHDANPYVETPASYPADPATHDVAAGWRGSPSDYGPLFTAASAGITDVTNPSGEAATFVFRVLGALAVLVTALLAARLALRKAFAAAFVGWNPLLAIDFAGGGHNDAWMVAALLVALLLLERRRHAAAGAMWIAAAAIKISVLPIVAVRLLRADRRVVVATLLVAAAVAAVATVAFGTAWLSVLGAVAHREATASIPMRLANVGLGEPLALALTYGLLLIAATWLTLQAVRGRHRLAMTACVVLITSPWLLPWYAALPVALAAVEEDGAAQLLALSLTAYLLPDRIPV
jgi:glycosyl transferase family 87